MDKLLEDGYNRHHSKHFINNAINDYAIIPIHVDEVMPLIDHVIEIFREHKEIEEIESDDSEWEVVGRSKKAEASGSPRNDEILKSKFGLSDWSGPVTLTYKKSKSGRIIKYKISKLELSDPEIEESEISEPEISETEISESEISESKLSKSWSFSSYHSLFRCIVHVKSIIYDCSYCVKL